MQFEERWYPCDFLPGAPAGAEPDWEKVPEERRAKVKEAWHNKLKNSSTTFYLWGPQIAFYSRTDFVILNEVGPWNFPKKQAESEE